MQNTPSAHCRIIERIPGYASMAAAGKTKNIGCCRIPAEVDVPRFCCLISFVFSPCYPARPTRGYHPGFPCGLLQLPAGLRLSLFLSEQNPAPSRLKIPCIDFSHYRAFIFYLALQPPENKPGTTSVFCANLRIHPSKSCLMASETIVILKNGDRTWSEELRPTVGASS